MALAEVASHPYAPKYWWWFVVNYMRQLLIIFFAVYGPRTNVSEQCGTLAFNSLHMHMAGSSGHAHFLSDFSVS